ncbi:ATP-citrate synthase (ATP-citrate (pro-S-)-lyase) [Coccidioides immitis H538.4]|uniref:ATP citrate synthase n=1 Tax=Coccidioides immitis H538.4 TaxID=396776 RepID=A0A0J8RWX3_COCIT|nr:ATP-citrate synthase (ATP-citrate (pro-S-)-lyase) [Coccidioides immitis H538.4]
MSAKSIYEADGKAILNYHLTRAPVIKPSPLPAPTTHNAPAKLASLHFDEDCSVEGVLDQAESTYPWLLAKGAKFVAKPDQLIKRRGKSGLLALNKTWEEAREWIAARAGKPQQVETVTGVLRHFLVEPFVPHPQETEYYININSVREINPLVVIPNADKTSAEVHFLDLAAKLDQTAEFECGTKWAVARSPAALGIRAPLKNDDKVTIDAGPPMDFPAPFGRELSKEEKFIADMDAKTGASLKLTVLNSTGRIWTLVAGGGASVVYADAIASAGFVSELANYGEYSGAPTETQTYNYARTVLDLMLRAPMHPDGKVLFIGGGIANFTNVATTFKGVIRALREVAPVLNEHKTQIWVRRAGPNYQEGLKNIKAVGEELHLNMHVYGPEMHVSGIVPLALNGKTTDVKEFGEA